MGRLCLGYAYFKLNGCAGFGLRAAHCFAPLCRHGGYSVLAPRSPTEVIPEALSEVLAKERYWFLIGGHAVRCFCPYRPSRDVDLGVLNERDLKRLLTALERSGRVRVLERDSDTVHLRWNEIDVSLFVLPKIGEHVEDRRLTVTGILATKLHALLDRGMRRDFFDLYVMLQSQKLGIAECLNALRDVYRTDVDDGLLLRALTYFDDADRESPLPDEGPNDWRTVKDYFISRVSALLIPPERILSIQERKVGLSRKLKSRGSR
jgi:hypothetical protein